MKKTKEKKSGRMSNVVRDRKTADGQLLYCKGYSCASISSLIDVAVETVRKWKRDFEWEKAKEMYLLTPSALNEMIFEAVQAMINEKKPKYSPDQITKIVASFDKVNDHRKKAVYTIEVFSKFSDHLLDRAAKQKNKEAAINEMNKIRSIMDEYLNEVLLND